MEKYYIGLDGGSTYLKAAMISGRGVVDTIVHSTGIDNNGTAERLVAEICERNRVSRDQVGGIMATGYSRKILEAADDDISEITAHAYGIRMTAPSDYRPGMIIDIGGQDSKIIYLDERYTVKNFTMNDKLGAKEPCDINSTCVVFAQSEVISLIARKYDRRDILAGMHRSMARRIVKMMKKSEKRGDILMTGGGALNIGLRRAFEDELMEDIFVADHPQFNGAIGAALIARERSE